MARNVIYVDGEFAYNEPHPGLPAYVRDGTLDPTPWIWCDDRLPEGHEAVLICQQGKRGIIGPVPTPSYISVAEYRPEHNEWWKVGRAGYALTSVDVLAWHPLPDLPSAEEIAAYVARTEGSAK